MSVTIAHVAKKAKVSKTTVSRVLSKTPGFKYSEETCKKVFATAEAMGYTPSTAAQLMRLKDIKMVGICTQVTNSMFSYSMIERLSVAVKELGYYPILIDLNESFELLGAPHLHRLDYLRGIICLYTAQVGSIQKLCARYHKQIPIVSLGSGTKPDDNVRVVTTNHAHGSKVAVKHLNELGHKNILYVWNEKNKVSEKIEGFEQAVAECKLNGKIVMLKGNNERSYGFGSVIADYLVKNPEFTAVLCTNDEIAMGLNSSLIKHGIKVPDDISVIGYDDLAFAAYANPALTTVRQNTDEIISKSAKVLISSIEGSEIHNDFIPSYTSIKPELIIRESTKKLTK